MTERRWRRAPRMHERTDSGVDPHARRGVALPGVLLLLIWLTGVTGWLVAHTAWNVTMQRDEHLSVTLGTASDALAALAARSLTHEPDWHAVLSMTTPAPCPGTTTIAVPPGVIVDETTRLQAASDVLDRWPAGQRLQWRPWLACDAGELLGGWRASSPAPWVLALIADDPDGHVLAGQPAQVVVAAVAGAASGGRTRRIVTVRRAELHLPPSIVAWRLG